MSVTPSIAADITVPQLVALSRLAKRGDEDAVGPVLKVLQRVHHHERGDFYYSDMSRMVNKHAVKALGTLAGRGDEEALKALHLRILDDPEPLVREAAARSLGNIADAEDFRSIAALYLCMEDSDPVVRRTATKSVRAMLRRKREELACDDESSEDCEGLACELDEDDDENAEEVLNDELDGEECGASRLWLLPGIWGG